MKPASEFLRRVLSELTWATGSWLIISAVVASNLVGALVDGRALAAALYAVGTVGGVAAAWSVWSVREAFRKVFDQ